MSVDRCWSIAGTTTLDREWIDTSIVVPVIYKFLCKDCSFRSDMLTNMAATGDSCFWLADFLNSSHLKPFGQMNRNLVGSIYGRTSVHIAFSSRSVNKHGHQSQFLFPIGWFLKKNLYLYFSFPFSVPYLVKCYFWINSYQGVLKWHLV